MYREREKDDNEQQWETLTAHPIVQTQSVSKLLSFILDMTHIDNL